MPHCTADGLRLSGLGRRVVEATFDGGAITSDGGALLLREAERRTGVLEQLSRQLVDERDPRFTEAVDGPEPGTPQQLRPRFEISRGTGGYWKQR